MISRIFLSIIFFSFFVPAVVFAATPHVSYPFDERGGMTSVPLVGVGSAHLDGGVGWASGKSGTAVGFEGKSGQSVSLGENILPQGIEGSVSLWVKTNTRTDRNYFFSARSTTDDKKYFTLQGDKDGRLLVRYRSNAGSSDQRNESGTVLDNNTWYHVVLTANSQRYLFYVNGELVTQGLNNPNLGKWVTDLHSGNMKYTLGSLDASDQTGSFDGYIDDVRIYTSVLTPEEITALYMETNEKKPTNPIGAVPEIQFTSGEEAIPFGGSVKVMWSAQYASSCSGLGKTNLPLSGEEVITKVAQDLNVSVTCKNSEGKESQRSLVVRVIPVKEVILTNTGTSSSKTQGGNPIVLTRTLSVGSRGNEVTLLQEYLSRKGYLSVLPTGYFGKLTQEAVKAFQKAQNLEQVGIVGPKTRAQILSLP